jgi:hypothetical protein
VTIVALIIVQKYCATHSVASMMAAGDVFRMTWRRGRSHSGAAVLKTGHPDCDGLTERWAVLTVGPAVGFVLPFFVHPSLSQHIDLAKKAAKSTFFLSPASPSAWPD